MSALSGYSSNLKLEMNDPIEEVHALLEDLEHIRHQDYHRVIQLAEKAHLIAHEAEYWPGVAKSLYHIADSYLRLGNYAAAVSPAQQALSTARTHHLPIEEAYALSSLGAVYSYLGDESQATELFFEQLRIAEEHHDLTLTGYAYGDIGTAYLRTENWEKGLALLQKAIDLFDSEQREQENYLWYYNIAQEYVKQGELTRATSIFQDLYDLSTRNNIPESIILSLTGLASIKAEFGDFAHAHTYIDQALGVIQSTNSALKADVILQRGEIYNRQDNLEAGIVTLNTALELANQTQNWFVVTEAQRILCELYEKAGDFQQALIHYRAFQKAQEKAFNDRSDSRAQMLMKIYEIESVRKEAEIQQLRLQAAEHELAEYKRDEAKRLEVERLKVTLESERELAQSKEDMLTRISHEFRTPLTIIRTSTEILTHYADRLNDDKRQTYQKRIDDQFKWVDKLLNDIGLLLKNEPQQISRTKESTSIGHIVNQAIQEAEQQAMATCRIDMEVETNGDTVWIERQILTEVLTQLLSNGLKFSKTNVKLHIQKTPHNLTFKIIDKGIGIPLNEQAKVFESLYRASNNDEVRGNGLGLTIVRDYLSLIGGTIHLNSTPNEGTTAIVSIPLKPETA